LIIYENKEMKYSIIICISTFNRCDGLARLLKSLSNLKFKKNHPPDWGVVVVDNNSDCLAKGIVDHFQKDFPVQIYYGLETQQGIASSRNKAVNIAPQSEYIAFIDDDEIADEYWLDELLYVQKIYQADIVSGPVVPIFEEEPPNWIIRGGFYKRPRRKTGDNPKYIGTGNVLIKSEWLNRFPAPFDFRLNLTGGSDTLFFLKLRKLGAVNFWANDAIVHEMVSKNRMKVVWLIRRAFRSGYATVLIEKIIKDNFTVLIIRLLKSFYHMMISVLMLLPCIIKFGYAGIIKSIQMFSRGLGEIFAIVGGKFEEYSTSKQS
jgi:glycosyltransferase involved in cell wall biosynthesis